VVLERGAGALNMSALSTSRGIGKGVFLLKTAPFEPMNIAGPVETLNAGFSLVDDAPLVPVERIELFDAIGVDDGLLYLEEFTIKFLRYSFSGYLGDLDLLRLS
jgi:hypothetical protein